MGISAAEWLRRAKTITLPLLQEDTRKVIQRSPKLLRLKTNEFRRGENSEGGRIGYYRNPNYRLFKQQLNPIANGTVDLILTGQFTRGLFVESKRNSIFYFDSTDDKAPDLFERYEDIRGIQEYTFREFQRTDIAPELTKLIKSILQR